MLYAELHNKFDLETLDFERSEDILTSTVFGTLLTAEGGQPILRDWLLTADFGDKTQNLEIPQVVADYRFWPSLGGTTPDLALRFDNFVCVLEMKYRSGASDIQREDAPEPELQLAKQWAACKDGSRLMQAFGTTDRFKHSTVLYVVDAVRGVKGSRKSIDKARKYKDCDDARIGILFWQHLHMALREVLEDQLNTARWIGDLAMLLEKRQLGTFAGFPKRFDPAAAQGADSILRWRRPPYAFGGALKPLEPVRLMEFSKKLSAWRPQV